MRNAPCLQVIVLFKRYFPRAWGGLGMRLGGTATPRRGCRHRQRAEEGGKHKGICKYVLFLLPIYILYKQQLSSTPKIWKRNNRACLKGRVVLPFDQNPGCILFQHLCRLDRKPLKCSILDSEVPPSTSSLSTCVEDF